MGLKPIAIIKNYKLCHCGRGTSAATSSPGHPLSMAHKHGDEIASFLLCLQKKIKGSIIAKLLANNTFFTEIFL
ncbi:MAG: hypothetical protein ABI091_13810 [Ferruginibacter sp.]